MIDLESALFDLADHLDHPPGNDLGAAVLRRISTPAPAVELPRRRARALLAIAAAFLLIIATVVAIAPARRAVARWLGIGAVQIRVSDHPLPPGTGPNTVPGAPGSSGSSAPGASHTDAEMQLAAARKTVHFPIAVTHDPTAGALSGVEVDPRVRDGLVVLRYPRLTIVEIATDPTQELIGKLIGPDVSRAAVTVAGRPGLWIAGAHEIGYLDRAGRFRTDTVRTSGPVLLWERSGVTYRIEGIGLLPDAQAIAASMR